MTQGWFGKNWYLCHQQVDDIRVNRDKQTTVCEGLCCCLLLLWLGCVDLGQCRLKSVPDMSPCTFTMCLFSNQLPIGQETNSMQVDGFTESFVEDMDLEQNCL